MQRLFTVVVHVASEEKPLQATYVIGTQGLVKYIAICIYFMNLHNFELFFCFIKVRGVSEILKEAEKIEKEVLNNNDQAQLQVISGDEQFTLITEEKSVKKNNVHSSTFDVLALQQLLKEEQRRNSKLQGINQWILLKILYDNGRCIFNLF